MSKRKRQPEAAAPRPAARRPRGRLEGERRGQTLIVALAIGVVVAALAIALFGYYQTQIAPKGDPVLKVEDRSFSLRYFERRARYEIRNNPSFANFSQAGDAANALISLVRDEELLRLGAAEQGVAVTEEDIDNEIRSLQSISVEADAEVFAAAYRDAVRESGLATSDFRELIAAQLLEDRLRQKFEDEVPATTEQVRYRIIQVATTDEAEDVRRRLAGGEDFAALAAEVSIDEASKNNGGEQGWAARGTLGPTLEEFLFDLEPGQPSEVFETGSSALIFEVEERQANRQVTDEQKPLLATQAFSDWLEEVRERSHVEVLLDDDQTLSIVEALVDEARRQT